METATDVFILAGCGIPFGVFLPSAPQHILHLSIYVVRQGMTLCQSPSRPFLHVRPESPFQVTDKLPDFVQDSQYIEGAYASVFLLAVFFLLLSCLAFAAGISVETILVVAGILILLLLVFLSGA